METKNNIKRKKDQLEHATNRVIYWNRETDNNNYCKIATNKQKKAIELVHNNAQYYTT